MTVPFCSTLVSEAVSKNMQIISVREQDVPSVYLSFWWLNFCAAILPAEINTEERKK